MNTQLAKRQQGAKNTIRHLAGVMAQMQAKMERRSSGDELQVLNQLLQAMQTVAAALSLPSGGSAPLFLGLSIASNGIFTADSSVGIIGPSIARLVQALSDGFVAELMPKADLERRRFLTLSILACYVLMACLASRTADQGLGQFSEELDAADLKSARVFAFELALLLINSSGAMEEAFKVIIAACGGEERAQKVGAPLLAQIGNLLMIFVGTQDSRRKPADIIGEQEKYVQRGATAAAEAMAQAGDHESPAVAAASVALNQLQIALDEKNYEGCIETLNALLENLGTSSEALYADIKQLRKTAQVIAEAIAQESEEPVTGTVHVA